MKQLAATNMLMFRNCQVEVLPGPLPALRSLVASGENLTRGNIQGQVKSSLFLQPK